MPKKLRSAKEVMEALLAGEKVSSELGVYWVLGDDNKLLRFQTGDGYICQNISFDRDGWEIYREPPKPCGFVEAYRSSKRVPKDMYSESTKTWLRRGVLNRHPVLYDPIDTSTELFERAMEATDWLPVEDKQ